MKRLTAILLAAMLVMTGCFTVYEIKPDGTTEKIELNGNGEEPELIEEPTVEEPVVEVTNDTEIEEPEVVEEPEIIEEEPINEGVDEELIDQLFVTQFANDEPYGLDVAVADLDNTEKGWSFDRKEDHEQVTGYYDFAIDLYDAFFVNTEAIDEKVMYLTFDEGYENGYTATILDTLKANNVKATFFITGHYINTEPELVQRMVDEGHIVGNHSVNHPSMPSLAEEDFYDEISGLNDKYKDLIGKDLDPFFRPPMGKYSERSLYLTRMLGYRTIFWSMAFKDWDPDDQPGKEYSYNHVLENAHNGAIILLHAVSESDTLALDGILKDLKAEGYRFGSLYELD